MQIVLFYVSVKFP